MVDVTGTIESLTGTATPAAVDGTLTISLVYPIIDDPATSTAPFATTAVAGLFSFSLPASISGNAYNFVFQGIAGLRVFYIQVPNVASITLADLINSHQVDHGSLVPVTTGTTIDTRLTALEAAVLALQNP